MLEKEGKINEKERKLFYDECLGILKAKHGDSNFYLPQLDMYVMTTLKAQQLMKSVLSEGATIQHTNKAGHTNNVQNPKARLFTMMNDQAMKLAKDLGLSGVSKVRRTVTVDKVKKKFNTETKI